jgi:AcrR family transcriptional regulator
MVRTQQPLEHFREARLLLAAADEFLAHGYQQASLNRIIAAAGMGKSSFYHYFADKQALYDHLLSTLTQHFAAQRATLDRSALTRETFWSELDAALRRLGAAGAVDPAQRALARLFHAHSGHDDGFGRLRKDLYEGLGAVLQRGQELGAVRTDLPIDLVLELAAGWLFALDRWAADQPDPVGDSAAAGADQALRVLYEALAVQ